jgi:hypothetical protein
MKNLYVLSLSLILVSIAFVESIAQHTFDVNLNERKNVLYEENETISFENLVPGKLYDFYFSAIGVSPETRFVIANDQMSFVESKPFMISFISNEPSISGVIKDLDWETGSIQEINGILLEVPQTLSIDSSGIVVEDSQDIQEIVRDILLGDKCISVGTVSITGDSLAFGQFSNGLSSIGLENGVVISSGAIKNALGPNEQSGTSTALGSGSDADMELLTGNTTRDCSIIEFDFLPDQDSVSFEYVFASEEYCDFTFSSFNDGFGFFLSGDGINGPFSNNSINLAYLPDGTTPVTINNVNWGTNGEYYVDNNPTTFFASGGCTQEEIDNEPAAADFIEYDGFTTVLEAKSAVTPCTPYHIKLVVCDAVDQVYDSAVFIGKNSFTSGYDGAVEATIGYTNTFENEVQEGCNQAYIAFERFGSSADSVIVINIEVDGTSSATENDDYLPIPESFIIDQGVWKDTLWVDIVEDGLIEGIENINLSISGLCACLNTLHQIFIDDPMGEVTINKNYEICPGDSIVVAGESFSEEGNYTVMIESELGCDSTINIHLTHLDQSHEEVYLTIENGESVEVNGVEYNAAGVYTQILTGANGCDSTLTIALSSVHNIVYHSLNACSAITDVSNINYDEFIPEYPEPLDCGSVVSSNVYRLNPEVNAHSCTEGMNGEVTMCVSSLDDCSFEAGSEKAVLIDLTIYPADEFEVSLTKFDFYENAPDEFNWVNGASGTNNPPTLYGFRVLKNGAEIFSSVDNPTSNSFSLQSFDFEGMEDFTVSDTTTFTFEMLGYCLAGTGAFVSAWDLDEINISASCTPIDGLNREISGRVYSYKDEIPMPNILIDRKLNQAESIHEQCLSNEEGYYGFPSNPFYENYILSAHKTDEILQGVSTLDLVLIQKHILGILPFSSPDQMLAADINNSGDISGLDLLILRKLILGIDQDFPESRSWLFLEAAHELAMENPWYYHSEIGIDELSDDVQSADFKTIKIGDVNESFTNAYYADAEVRNVEQIDLEFADRAISAGEKAIIGIFAEDALVLDGIQMKFDLVDGLAERVLPGTLDIQPQNYSLPLAKSLSLSWNALNAVHIPAGSPLFYLEITAEKNGRVSDFLKLAEEGFSHEAYRSNLAEIYGLTLNFKEVEQSPSAILYQNTPNPFSGITTLKFYLPESNNADILIVDMQGHILHQINEHFASGMHEIPLALAKSLNGPGVYLCKLIVGKDQFMNRLVLIE